MSWITKAIGGALGPYIVGAAAVVIAGALALAGLQTVRLGMANKALAKVTGERDAARQAYALSERQRGAEATQARDNVNQINADCRADILQASKAGRTIERIVNAPAPPPGAPRGRIGADQLCAIAGDDTCPDEGRLPAGG